MKSIQDTRYQHIENLYNIRASLLEYRCYGDNKLKKPKELKGLKPIKSFNLIGKKVDVYSIGNREMVLHFKTLFSKLATFKDAEDMQLPTSALARKYNFNKGSYKTFIYPDAWCTIYNCNEGYILITGLVECFADLFALHISPIKDKLYEQLRCLSCKDYRFKTLQLTPIGADSCDYCRLCSDLVDWLYISRRCALFENRQKFIK